MTWPEKMTSATGRQHERSAPPAGVSDYKIAGWLGEPCRSSIVVRIYLDRPNVDINRSWYFLGYKDLHMELRIPSVYSHKGAVERLGHVIRADVRYRT